MSKDSFYCHFSSDVEDPVYNGQNKISHFITRLSPPIKLDSSDWKCSLVEMHMTNSFDILRTDKVYRIHISYENPTDPPNRKGMSITLPSSRSYTKVEEVLKDINEGLRLDRGLKGIEFMYIKTFDRVSVIGLNGGEIIKMTEPLRDILGYQRALISVNTESDFEMKYGVEAKSPPGLGLGWSSLIVYSDMVHNSRIGNSTAPVLRVLPRKTTSDAVLHYSFQNLTYVDVAMKDIEIVTFSLRDEKGNLVNINRGIISLTVHFKKQ